MEKVEKIEKVVPICFLCGEDKEEIEGKDLSEFIEGDETFACFNCLAQAAVSYYEKIHKSKWKTRMNWGFWVLIITFVLFLITWFVIKPRLGGP
jgi:hypothetical protein